MNNVQFTKQLVKGRIAETIFSQMLRSAGCFTVLEFGYEKVIPDLLQYNHGHDNPVIETLRAAPDFAVINRETKEVHLIEVKYRRHLKFEDALNIAQRMHESWNPSYLFVATLDGFYFDKVGTVISNEGRMSRLRHPQIPAQVQAEYLEVLREFESAH